MTNKTIQLTERLYEYLIGVSLREPEILWRLHSETSALPEAEMQIAAEQGQFMALLCELIAATGFGPTALYIAAERRWVSPHRAQERVRVTLRFLLE